MNNVFRAALFLSVLLSCHSAFSGEYCWTEWIPDPNSGGNNNPDMYPGSYDVQC